jgi:hypothetical protein
MTTNLGFDIELALAFGDTVARVKDALKQEGFGILTEIDLQAAFREKLGREFRPYVIPRCLQSAAGIFGDQHGSVDWIAPAVQRDRGRDRRTTDHSTSDKSGGLARDCGSRKFSRTRERRSGRRRADGACRQRAQTDRRARCAVSKFRVDVTVDLRRLPRRSRACPESICDRLS